MGLISQHCEVTDTLILTVSKGQGATNENQGRYSVLGGKASTNWPTSISVGDPYGPATSYPQFSCTPANNACRLPFKIGVPQTFTITLAAIFKGILLFQDAFGKPLKVEARLDRTPLPA